MSPSQKIKEFFNNSTLFVAGMIDRVVPDGVVAFAEEDSGQKFLSQPDDSHPHKTL